ncbi:MAG: LacI family DNA-binding transcriptional regulator [Eubacteriales bacterium]|nr:LacI family DNA-binding transcriptional regulator [Eubacteriales bacterium]
MANMREIAKRAGVGVGTVSRTLNGTGYVALETQEKVRTVARKMGYEHEPAGKGRTQTGMIGVVVPGLEHPFFAGVLHFLDLALAARGLRCLVCGDWGDGGRLEEFLGLLEQGRLDGLIACVDAPEGFKSRGNRAIVALDRSWPKDVPLVRSDHEQGGRMAAEALLEAGCRNVIQFYSGEKDRSANLRHAVFEQVLRESGCQVTSVASMWNKMSYGYDRDVIRNYWNVIRTMDGCFANDLGAINCLAVASEMGRKVPEQLKLVGYDGTDITCLCYPQVSAVEQDQRGLAEACVEELEAMISGKKPENLLVKVPVRWQKRGTT